MDEQRRRSDLLNMVAYGQPRSDVIAFPADPASATDARHFVRRILCSAGITTDVAENVELVACELVTNAVLHAGTGPTLTLTLRHDLIRVEVRDTSTESPILPHFGTEATTGRGLSVVSRSAKDWGFDTDQFGKTVWAEFAVAPTDGLGIDQAPQIRSEVIVDSRITGPTKLIVFKDVPVNLYLELEQANDATLREFELLAIQVENRTDKVEQIHQQLAALIVQSSTYFNASKSHLRAAILRARRRSTNYTDLRLNLDDEAVGLAEELGELMAEADDLSERGVLLTAPATEPVRQLRAWIIDEIKHQFIYDRPPIAFSLRH